jgi:3-phosphoshikimate 1-carboxyvinyltransferase
MAGHGSPRTEDAAAPPSRAEPLRLARGGAAAPLCLALAALAAGGSAIAGLPPGRDLPDMQAALRAMGARVSRAGGALVVEGVGNGCLLAPAAPLDFDDPDCALLALGLVGSYGFETTVTCRGAAVEAAGLLAPLRAMGAQVLATAPDGGLPVTLRGPRIATPVERRFADAQASPAVLCALLLAALNVPGATTVTAPPSALGPAAEILAAFGASPAVTAGADGLVHVRLRGQGRLAGRTVQFADEEAAAAPPR